MALYGESDPDFRRAYQGIDVGAKAEIYALIGRLAGEGYAILVVSSDQMELIGISTGCM